MSRVDPLDLEASDRVAQERDKRIRETLREEAEDFKWLMSDKRGRRIVWRLLEQTAVFRNPYTGNADTNFNCGKLLVGQHYWGLLQANASSKYDLMVKENRNDGQ